MPHHPPPWTTLALLLVGCDAPRPVPSAPEPAAFPLVPEQPALPGADRLTPPDLAWAVRVLRGLEPFPEWKGELSPPFLLITHERVPAALRSRLPEVLGKALATLERTVPAGGHPLPLLVIRIFPDARSFTAYGGPVGGRGRWSAAAREIILASTGREAEDLCHAAALVVHPWLHHVLEGREPPDWLAYRIADALQRAEGGPGLDPAVLEEMLQEGSLPPLRRFLRTHRMDMHRTQGRRNRVQAGFLVAFLLSDSEDARGLLDRYLGALHRNVDGHRRGAVLAGEGSIGEDAFDEVFGKWDAAAWIRFENAWIAWALRRR